MGPLWIDLPLAEEKERKDEKIISNAAGGILQLEMVGWEYFVISKCKEVINKATRQWGLCQKGPGVIITDSDRPKKSHRSISKDNNWNSLNLLNVFKFIRLW